jgi:cytochrome d ubiquinol oxidase subunit II
VGLFALALFALLAAVYLCADSEGDLREDFRTRALVGEAVAGLLALVAFFTAQTYAADLYADLARSPWTWPLQIGTALCAGATCIALWKRAYRAARVLAAGQVALVIVGWAGAMNGHIVMRDVHLGGAGAQGPVLDAVLIAVAIGTVILAPSLWLLFRLFK